VSAGEDLDRLRLGAVTGDPTVVVAVGAHPVGQQLGVASIRFRPRDLVAVAIASHPKRVDRERLEAGRDQRLDLQAAVGFDADHDLAGFSDSRLALCGLTHTCGLTSRST
jgi:hypothetical protein